MDTADFVQNHGGPLLTLYGNSPSKLVMEVYSPSSLPSTIDNNGKDSKQSYFEWKPFLFKSVPRGFYDEKANVRAYLDDIKAKAKVENDVDLKMHHFAQFGALKLLKKFRNSPILVARAAGGEPVMDKRPLGYWQDKGNQRAFLDDLAKYFDESSRKVFVLSMI